MKAALYQQWAKDTRKFWDSESEFEAKYRRICSDPEIDSCEDESRLKELWEKRTREELDQLIDGVPIREDWSCLEIGAGIGRLLKPMAQRCHQAVGVDISAKMVSYAENYLADTPNAKVMLNDGMTLSGVEDSSIDFAYSHLAFQHLTMLEVVKSYLAEIHRILKPGGYCRIQCWREAETPIKERFKNILRPILGKTVYHGPRRWLYAPGKEVKFGGITFHPHQWQHLLRKHRLTVTNIQLGMGHEYWMWTTSRKQ